MAGYYDSQGVYHDGIEPNSLTNPRGGSTSPVSPTPGISPSVGAPAVPTPGGLADASVSTQLNGLLSKNNPYMQQATTQGLQFANKRGLLNSSIAAGAVDTSRISAALPIASQNASQINQQNLQRMGINSNEKIAGMNIASNDREKSEAAATAAEQTYAQLLANVTGNANIPADYRDKLLTHISTLRDNYFNVLQQLYGINLDWASPAV